MADSTSAQSPESAPEARLYTLETLKEHGSRESMWMLLHDKVYDVTKFMDEVSDFDLYAW